MKFEIPHKIKCALDNQWEHAVYVPPFDCYCVYDKDEKCHVDIREIIDEDNSFEKLGINLYFGVGILFAFCIDGLNMTMEASRNNIPVMLEVIVKLDLDPNQVECAYGVSVTAHQKLEWKKQMAKTMSERTEWRVVERAI